MVFGIAADLLRQGVVVERLSLVATAGGLLLAILGGRVEAGMLAAGLGIAQGWLALRVGFDARLFARLAGQPDLAAFDAAMTDLGLMPPAKAGRPVVQRFRGARRLLHLQAGVLLAQALVLAIATGALS